jgi:hypothetical protein
MMFMNAYPIGAVVVLGIWVTLTYFLALIAQRDEQHRALLNQRDPSEVGVNFKGSMMTGLSISVAIVLICFPASGVVHDLLPEAQRPPREAIAVVCLAVLWVVLWAGFHWLFKRLQQPRNKTSS